MAALTNYHRNKLIDFGLRGQAWSPPATGWIRLVTTTPSAAAAGTEVAAASYDPVSIPLDEDSWSATQSSSSNAVPSSGTSGASYNLIAVDFGTAAEAWGTVVGWELWDAETGGNRLYFGLIVDGEAAAAPRTITTDDPVIFEAGTLVVIYS